MDELFEKMKKLIADRLEIDESKITMDSSFRQDLGADSLDTYELVYAIEEELGITIEQQHTISSRYFTAWFQYHLKHLNEYYTYIFGAEAQEEQFRLPSLLAAG